MLAERGAVLREGTIVDATILAAAPSTKNKAKERDPEMHQTKKGNARRFGTKARMGVDLDGGQVHTVVGTAANAEDVEIPPIRWTGKAQGLQNESGSSLTSKPKAATWKKPWRWRVGTSMRLRRISEYSDEVWDEVLEVNLHAQFILSRGIGREMLRRRRGKIIFTASLLSFQGGLFVPAYAASKGGVAQLMMALSNEWAAAGVTVNAIAPGYIATENTAPLQADRARSESILARIPAGRWGQPDDLKGAIVFLACEASTHVTGTILTVDGG